MSMDDNIFSSISPTEKRFGFKTTGEFRCSYPTEELLIMGLTLFCIVLYVGVSAFSGSGRFTSTNSAHILQYNFLEYAGLFVSVILWFIGMGFIFSGIKFSYTADEFKFVITSKYGLEAPLTFYYHDVSRVEYKDSMRFMLTKKGYIVKVITNTGETHTFRYLHNQSSKSFGTKATPFYIIEERVELERKQKQQLKEEVDNDVYTGW